ncbi:MAG: hypothetical protein LBB58_02550 [Cellulomonadaceae bacterium]|jgi:hypothetical protein|nr:hypothetical protein [Cellulomonadaceae bacterium]
MESPNDTIRVYGGKPISRIAAEEVLAAASYISDTANSLAKVANLLRVAIGQLEFAVIRWNVTITEQTATIAAHYRWLGAQNQFCSTLEANAMVTISSEITRLEIENTNLVSKAITARGIASELHTIASKTNNLSESCQNRCDAVLKAAGLYQECENRVSRIISKIITAQTAISVGRVLKHPFASGLSALTLAGPALGAGWIAHKITDGASTKAVLGGLVPALAPHTDELVGGLSVGLAAGLPALSSGQISTTGGVAALSTLGRLAVRPGAIQVFEITAFGLASPISNGSNPVPGANNVLATNLAPATDQGPLRNSAVAYGSAPMENSLFSLYPIPVQNPEFAPKIARYQGTASGTVLAALSRVGDLHPFDHATAHSSAASGNTSPETYPTQGRGGLPTGTIGVERVTHRDGSVTWTVLIPGTQSFAPGVHAFDGITDLDLMAHRQSQVNEQVMKALELVGADKSEPIVLVGHSLGGIAAMSLASSAIFNDKYSVGGVITAGSPTATFTTIPSGVPVLHLENDEEVVSNLDGKSGQDNPQSADRVTVTRRLAASTDPIDQRAASSLEGAHPIETHQRTLELALENGNAQVIEVTQRLNELLDGESAQTRYFTGRRE